jgi:hypothetical protein
MVEQVHGTRRGVEAAMRIQRIKQFSGIAPKYGEDVPAGVALVCDNVDLRSGKIRPTRSPELVDDTITTGNSLFYFYGAWRAGDNKFYNRQRIGDVDILHYLDGTTLKKNIQDNISDVGQPQPVITGTADQGTGSLPNGTYRHIITTVRRVGDYFAALIDEITSEADFAPLASGGRNVSESQVDYSSPVPPEGRLQLQNDIKPYGETNVVHTYESMTAMLEDGGWNSTLAQVKDGGNSQQSITSVDEMRITADFQDIMDASPASELESVGFHVWAARTSTYHEASIDIKVNGTWYNGTPHEVTTGKTLARWRWWTNPDTGTPWDRDNIGMLTEVRYTKYPSSISINILYEIQPFIEEPPYHDTGTVRFRFDLGPQSYLAASAQFLPDHNFVGDQDIEYHAYGSNQPIFGGEEADLGVILENDVIAIYRYYEVLCTLTRGTDPYATPWIDGIILQTPETSTALEDESGPSEPSTAVEITTSDGKIRVTRGTVLDPAVVFWNIYRIDEDATTAYQFVAQVDIADTYYDDEIPNVDLQGGTNSFFTSDQGNLIIYAQPGPLDGLMHGSHAGMLFAWRGSRVFWCEPGVFDAWPAIYYFNVPFPVMGIAQFAGSVAVMTTGGVYRIDGTHPELLSMTKSVCEDPMTGGKVWATTRGIVFGSDSGITVFSLSSAISITNEAFGEEWFKNNITPATIVFEENDDILYMVHSGGILVLDLRTSGSPVWKTLTLPYGGSPTSVWKEPDTGEIYFINNDGVWQHEASTDEYLQWTWRSGKLNEGDEDLKHFFGIRVVGVDTVNGKVILDGVEKGSKVFGLAIERNCRLHVPSRVAARGLVVELSGNGEVDELEVLYVL